MTLFPANPPLFIACRLVGKKLFGLSDPRGIARRFLLVFQSLLGIASVGYTLALLAWLLLLLYRGDCHWLPWFFTYVPPIVFLAPLVCLLPGALLLDWRQLLLLTLLIPLVLLAYQDFEWNGWRKAKNPEGKLTVLSNNIGQHGKHRLTPFVEKIDPDFIALQEASRRGPGYRQQYAHLQVEFVSQFILASRFPIEETKLVDILCNGSHIACRSVVNVNGRKLAFYNVRIPSPRDDLGHLRGRGLIAQVLGDLGLPGGRDYGVHESLRSRREATRKLAEKIRQEKLPVILAGDLNNPGYGAGYRQLRAVADDTFKVAGRGFGFTFPGKTHNPLSLFGPWLRLDYIFSGRDFRILSHQVEPDRPSQHRAVVAELEWRETETTAQR